MSMTSAAERAQHEDAAAQCVRAFLAVVPPVRLHLTDEARSDQATVAHAAAPNNKRAHGGNYLHRYLAWRADPRSAEQLAAFLSAKLEPERFLQWAGPGGTTIVQLTPAVTQLAGMRQIFDAALLNVFSVPLKPLDAAAFLRGVRQRFRIRRFVARAQGPQGLFRQDMPDTLSLVALDDDDREAHTTGRFVFGSIALVLVHRQLVATEHAVYSVSRGPYKAGAGTVAPAPEHLPTRACITWAPGVDFDAVEAWWRDLVHRPAVQAPTAVDAAAAGTELRFAGLQCPEVSPRGLVAGVKLIRVALEQGVSSLGRAVQNGGTEDVGASLEAITDAQLLHDPVAPRRSCDSDASALS